MEDKHNMVIAIPP